MHAQPREEAARWLAQAREDLHWAKDLAERGGYHIACFLAQQVGEKALKALCYAQGEEIVLGHSVERLCREAAAGAPELDQHVRRWAILDSYYIPTRYPNGLPEGIPAHVYTSDAAGGAVRLADEIVAFVSACLAPPSVSSR